MKKLLRFCKEVYDPGVHLYFALNWVAALVLGLAVNHGRALTFSFSWIAAILSLFLVLFYLRVIDEVKDLDYDRTHNPDRPLVKGLVSVKDLGLYCLASGLISLLINVPFGLLPGLIVLADLVYGALLIVLEKKARPVKDNMLLNLIFTYPVNVLLSFYILFLNLSIWQETASMKDLLLILAFASAFLYYEFVRKISWPHQERAGQRTYSGFFGTIPSVIIAEALALTAAALLILLYKTLLPILLLLPLLWGLLKFKKSKTKEKGLAMKLSGSAFIGLFYGLVIFIGIRELGFLS